jgi:hypothetical protein
MDDGLGIRVGSEDVAKRFKVATQLLEIVDLAIEDQPNRTIFVAHRLVASGAEVDDGQADEAEIDNTGVAVAGIGATVVWAAVPDAI